MALKQDTLANDDALSFGPYRLGYLMVLVGDTWGMLSSASFGNAAATVACKQLGYGGGGRAWPKGFPAPGDNVLRWQAATACPAGATNILNCFSGTPTMSDVTAAPVFIMCKDASYQGGHVHALCARYHGTNGPPPVLKAHI